MASTQHTIYSSRRLRKFGCTSEGSIINFLNKIMEKEITRPEWYYLAEMEFVLRTKVKHSQRPKITSGEDAYNTPRWVWDTDKIELVEDFKVLFLNKGNKMLEVFNTSSGGITGTVTDPRIILAVAVKSNSVSMILAHNHPSGNLTPSRADERLTLKNQACGAFSLDNGVGPYNSN